ncbi:type II toxin-antitoxin system RelE family toxin [Methanohalophilus mahii]|uniref:Plasmid stabilization system n=1 Tax=Methanohalophilus mahii (strain ATCC 35705 / DSM 5219 / SLP) TaxID=547558 RepID=D5E8V2_METMS|nr:type II toxin-antitoxin system RelE/ParE family toxin [Methanohalophilus mahii]ADE35611.1 plasmid stabilization system [Methanohalophilus mahii DSM 5219]
MKYNVNIHKEAVKYLNSLDPHTKEKIVEGLKVLGNLPVEGDIKKLKGTKGKRDLYRLRIGEYRAIYHVENNNVYVLEIMLRGKGYGWLDRLLVL